MSRKHIAVLAAALACTTCAAFTVQSEDAPPPPLHVDAAIENLGLCGPIHEAILRFGPRDGGGALDAEQVGAHHQPPDSWLLVMPASAVLVQPLVDSPPDELALYEFKGTLQSIGLRWPGPDFAAMAETVHSRLTEVYGDPLEMPDGTSHWYGDRFTTMLSRKDADGFFAVMIGCGATEEAFFTAEEAAAEDPSDGSASEAPRGEGSTPPNPWLDRSIVNVVLGWGEPLEDPVVTEDNAVGLHYRDFLPGYEVPTEGWWWFVDGKAVYAAADFMPPHGSRRALTSWRAFKDILRKAFGAPTEETLDEATGRRHVIYRTGPQRLVVTLYEPEGDPWFRLEVFDTTKLDALPDELRPDRSLPERYEPPPADSGLTREEMGFAVGAG